MPSTGKGSAESFVIGLTGGVGAGKSLVLKLLEEKWGALVLEADSISRALMEPGEMAYAPLVELLGRDILAPSGAIDRNKMAARIFQDPEILQAVNGLLHPATFQAVQERIYKADGRLVVYESALPREARFSDLCQKILYVYAPRRLRQERLESSRGYSPEKIRAIMKNQLTEQAYRGMADSVLDNSKSPESALRGLNRILLRWGIQAP